MIQEKLFFFLNQDWCQSSKYVLCTYPVLTMSSKQVLQKMGTLEVISLFNDEL